MSNGEMMVMSSPIISKLPYFMESVHKEKAPNIKRAVESEVVKIKLEAVRNDYNKKRKLLISLDDYDSLLTGALTKKMKKVANEERIVATMKGIIHTIDDILKNGSLVNEIKILSDIIGDFLESEHEVKVEVLKSITSVVNHMYSEFGRIAESIVKNNDDLNKKSISLALDESDDHKMKEIRFKIEVLKELDANDPYKEEMRRATLLKEDHEAEFEKLTSILEERRKELEEIESKFENVEKELKSEQMAAENLNKNLLERRNAIQEEINSTLNETIQKQVELMEQRKKLGQTEQLEQRKADLLKQLEDVEAKYSDIAADYTCVFCEHDEELKQETILENQLVQCEIEYNESQGVLDTKMAEIDEQRKALSEELNAIQKEQAEKERINAENEQEVKDFEEKLISLQEEVDKTTSEMQKKKGRKKALKNEIKELENQISELVMSQ
ncbi:uncharacterized protein LOC141848835 [Brevipalpus obovatus]|uniref:uncharacterized protein LOC141848835 n=1 Tax=Brevipalpus obovatus TaxID=246614 RepID=UPI003D9F8DDB